MFLVAPGIGKNSLFMNYKCYLNYDQGPEKRIRINFTQFNMIYYNQQKDDFETWPSAIMRLSLRNNQNQEERVTKVRLATDNMNILHYHEDGKDVNIRLANSTILKFYSIYVYLYLKKDTYEKPDQVSFHDIANKNLYFNGEMPYFTFTDKEGDERKARCEIELPDNLKNEQIPATKVQDPEMDLAIEQQKFQQMNNQGALHFEHQTPNPVNDLNSLSMNQTQERADSQSLHHSPNSNQHMTQNNSFNNQKDFILLR